jgi:hypothetical protein
MGAPQRWVNILGRITPPSEVKSATYSLNGGPDVPLTVGPDGVRLNSPGDFNVEIDRNDLAAGTNSLTISAADKSGRRVSGSVVIEYSAHRGIPPALAIQWNTPASIQDAGQVVDGRWAVGPEGVRSAETGYDRIMAIGDMSWRDYELRVPVTVHRIDPAYDNPKGGAGAGLIVRWKGHEAWNDRRPREGWWPLGAAAWYGWEPDLPYPHLMLHGNRGRLMSRSGRDRRLTPGVRYLFKLRAQTNAGQGTTYSFKVWKDGMREPEGWDLTGREDSSQPSAGSALLITHHVDASFGDVTITPVGAP